MNTTDIKIISCDLDGTLLNVHGKISDYSLSVLLDLQKKGYCLVLNSGRFYHEVEPFIKQLELEKYGGYVICSNGYIIYDCKLQTSHSFEAISYDECLKLFKCAKKEHVFLFYYINGTYQICAPKLFNIFQYVIKGFLKIVYPLLLNNFKYYVSMYMKTNLHTFENIPSFTHVEKLCFIQFSPLLRNLRKAILNHEHSYQFFDVNSYSIELVKNNVSKADAITYLCKQKEYTISQVIAFGDAGNDIPLLQQAGIGVLMKNAHGHMKEYTSIQTAYDNAHDGVARFLKDYL